MNVTLKSAPLSFKSFLNSQSRHIVFTALFYSLWLAKDVAQSQNFDLHSFTNRMIGIATMVGYDVAIRVSVFYKFLGVLIASFFIFNLAGYFIFKRNASLLSCMETKIINHVSLAGIPFFVFKVFEYDVSETMELLYCLHKLMLAAILLRLFFFRKVQLTLYHHTFIFLLSASGYFLVSDCFILSNTGIVPDFFLTAFVIACILIIGLSLLLKNDAMLKQPKIDLLAYCLLPVVLLPCLSVLKDELFLILKARQIHLNGPFLIYLGLILLLISSVLLRHRAGKKRGWMQPKDLVALRYFPLFIFSIVTYAKYSYYANFMDETFELGNKFLPIMEFKLFDVIPTLEKFNSHVLSDYFFSAIYTLIYGLKEFEMTLYDFLYLSVSYVLYYYLILYLWRNAFIAVFCVLIFPFCGAMLPEQFSFGVFAVFALQKIIWQQPSFKNYLVFFLTVAGLLLWRIDLGYSCIIIMPGLLLYYHFRSKAFKIKPGMLMASLLSVLGCLAFIVVCFSFYRGVNLFEKMPYALNYLASTQTYGSTSLGGPDQKTNNMHYFIFPGLVGIILIALLLKFNALNVSRGQRLSYLGLLFLCAFYLVNFNRGLVRHGLVEMTDHYTSSYIYIILPGAFLLFFRHQTQAFKFLGFCAISFFLILHYKIPSPNTAKSFFETGVETSRLGQRADLSMIGNRMKYAPEYKNNKDSLFIAFIHKNTGPDETFIDFSNNPMLYFYTKKITPSYFYQNPLCSHNEFLQNRFIADLSGYHTPYLSFCDIDGKGMDAVDNVPNTLRHYRLAEYFYANYSPYIVAGRIRVWKGNRVKDRNKKDTIYRFVKDSTFSSARLPLRLELKFKPGKNYMARLVVKERSGLILKTFFSQDSISQVPEFVTDRLAYCVLQPKEGRGSIAFENGDAVSEFQIIECDYVPDFYAEKSPFYLFLKLPYIWATYDKNVSKEPVLFETAPGVELQANEWHTLKIPEHLDRSSGNTILVACKNTSNNEQTLGLSFGNAGEKNKTIIYFTVLPSDKEERYAIRVSSIYKWYSDPVNELGLFTDSKALRVSTIKITKGL